MEKEPQPQVNEASDDLDRRVQETLGRVVLGVVKRVVHSVLAKMLVIFSPPQHQVLTPIERTPESAPPVMNRHAPMQPNGETESAPSGPSNLKKLIYDQFIHSVKLQQLLSGTLLNDIYGVHSRQWPILLLAASPV